MTNHATAVVRAVSASHPLPHVFLSSAAYESFLLHWITLGSGTLLWEPVQGRVLWLHVLVTNFSATANDG
jgi:hypothetical protein